MTTLLWTWPTHLRTVHRAPLTRRTLCGRSLTVALRARSHHGSVPKCRTCVRLEASLRTMESESRSN